MRFFKNGNRYTAVNEDGRFIEAKEFKQVKTISAGKNIIVVDDAKNNDVEISKDQFFAALWDNLNFLNEQVDVINV